MRGGDDAHVRPGRRLRRLLLEQVQELHLDRRRELGDFVQEQRAAAGLPNEPFPALARPGRVPEELRFLRIARQRAALHGDEGAFGARARIVERSRGELLAGPRFARDEDIGIRRRGLADQLEHAPDARALANDRPGAVGALQVALQDGVLARDAALVQRPRDGVQELVVVERLDEVVDGPGAQRADGALHGRVAGDHDDR